MVTDEGFLLQAVHNDKQRVKMGKYIFFNLVQHYVLTSSICPSLHQKEYFVEKRIESLSLLPLFEKPRATLRKLLECLIQLCMAETENTG